MLKRKVLSMIYRIETKTKTDIHKLLFDEVSRSSRNYIHNCIHNFFVKDKAFDLLLNELKVIMESRRLNSQQLKHVNKKWKFQFSIGRTVTRFNKNYICYEQHKWKKNKWVNMMNVRERNIPTWKKNLYEISYKLIQNINNCWVGEHEDFIIQFACMDKNSQIGIHVDNDISSQFLLTFGQYIGGELMIYNNERKTYMNVDTKNAIVQFDGRNRHYVSKILNGLRYSVVYYKKFDRRYNEQPIFTGIKTYIY